VHREAQRRPKLFLTTEITSERIPHNSVATEPHAFTLRARDSLAHPIAPVFTQHFEYRSTGLLPFWGASEATAAGFVREKITPTRIDAPAVIGLLDAFWPAIFAVESQPRAVATLSFAAQVLTDLTTLDPALPLFHRAEVVALREGFFVEMRELWSNTTLVAMNQQTFAILK
jgi:hypothetical protein